MCLILLAWQTHTDYPLVVAANRDELVQRPWRAPARHWRVQPDVIGGLDVTAGGTWLARSDRGVIAAVLNRINTLGYGFWTWQGEYAVLLWKAAGSDNQQLHVTVVSAEGMTASHSAPITAAKTYTDHGVSGTSRKTVIATARPK